MALPLMHLHHISIEVHQGLFQPCPSVVFRNGHLVVS